MVSVYGVCGGFGLVEGKAVAAVSRPRQLLTLSVFTTLRQSSRGMHYVTYTSFHSVGPRDPRGRAWHYSALGATASVRYSTVIQSPDPGQGTDGPCPGVRSQTGLYDQRRGR